jgi:hypothetical protein
VSPRLPRPLRPFLTVFLSLPGIFVVVPLLYGVFEGLGVAEMGSVLMALVAVVLASALSEPLLFVLTRASRPLALVPLALGAVLFLLGLLGNGPNAEHPKPSRLWYVLDADTGKTRWASSAAENDAWLAAYLGEHPTVSPPFPDWSSRWLQSDAPRVELPLPEVAVTEKKITKEGRELSLELRAGRDAALDIESAGDVTSAMVEGHELPWVTEAGGAFSMRYIDAGSQGVGHLTLQVRGKADVVVTVTERWSGLPNMPGSPELPSRPPWTVPHHDGDQTVVRRSFTL